MKFLNSNRALCISPHPDDVEYSFLATIAKYEDTIFDIICLCQGSDGDPTTGKERLEEVKSVWECANIKNSNLSFTDIKYIKDFGQDEWITYLEKNILTEFNYDTIILPNDEDSHWEHRTISKLGLPLIRVKKMNLVEYYTPSTQETWKPNLYIDISDGYTKKLKCLKKFKSQAHRYYFREDVLRAFHSDFQCAKKGMHIVEKFKIVNYYE